MTTDLGHRRDAPEFRRAGFALFCAGFATFSMIYCVQSLLPEFTRSFEISAATASLALSVTTGSLAVAILLSGALALSVGRRALIFVSIMLAATCNLATAFATDWHLFLLARAGEGFLLGGVPAIAMVYLAEEIDPRDLGQATGLYVAGTAGGAMIGRLGMGAIVDFGSWRLAMAALGFVGMAAAIGFLALLPASRRFSPQRGAPLAEHGRVWLGLLRDRGMLKLYATGFVLTSIFVTLFSYSTFRLPAGAKPDLPARLGAAFPSDNEFYKSLDAALRLGAQDAGVEYISSAGDGTLANSIQQAELVLNQGVAAL